LSLKNLSLLAVALLLAIVAVVIGFTITNSSEQKVEKENKEPSSIQERIEALKGMFN